MTYPLKKNNVYMSEYIDTNMSNLIIISHGW